MNWLVSSTGSAGNYTLLAHFLLRLLLLLNIVVLVVVVADIGIDGHGGDW